MTEITAHRRLVKVSVAEFVELLRLIRNAPRENGVQRAYALFAVAPKRRLIKVAANTPRFEDYAQQYQEYFVGVYDPQMRASELEDDLHAAGVRIVGAR